MKKILFLATSAFLISGLPALAEEGATPAKPGKHKMLESVDANGDGNITKEEFLKNAEEKFANMDANSDGTISKEEIEARRSAWKEKMKEHRAKKEQKAGEEKKAAE